MAGASLIAVDWGTTRLRAYLLGADRTILDRISHANSGMQTVREGQFADTLQGCIAPWLALNPDLPVIMAGMVGARNGWVEAPYASAPASAKDLAARMMAVARADGGEALIVPGVIYVHEQQADVMRGEETLIFGCGCDDALVVLPGTHSKWAALQEGRITQFSTYMTGEIYAWARQNSILSRLALEPEDEAGFERGLAAAHAVGIVHRDFKSENVILVDNDGATRAVITDFGVAVRAVDSATSRGMVGTPAYIAPELIDGGEATAAADLYSFGVVLYEMLSGTLPFVGSTALATALARLEAPPPPLSRVVPAIDPVLIALVDACLIMDPTTRKEQATPLLRALTRDDATVVPAARAPRRARGVLVGATLATAFSATLLALVAHRGATPPQAGPPTHRITHRTIIRPFVDSVTNRIDEDDATISFGLRELLRAEVSDAPQWRTVAPFTESMIEGGRLPSPNQLDSVTAAHFIAAGFSDYLIEGTFGKNADGQLDVTARLVDGAAGTLLTAAHATGADIHEVASKLGVQLRNALGMIRHTPVAPGLWPAPADEREYGLVLLDIQQRDLVGALTHMDRVTAAEPNFSQGSWSRSIICAAVGQLSEGLRTLNLSALPVDDAQTAVVSMDLVNGKFASKTSHAREILASDPFDPALRLSAIAAEPDPTAQTFTELEQLRASLPPEQHPQVDYIETVLRRSIGDYAGVVAAVPRCSADATAQNDRYMFAHCNLYAADAAVILLRWDDALRLAGLAEEAASSYGDQSILAGARDVVWDVLLKRGHFADLEGNARQMSASARAHHDVEKARAAEVTLGAALMEDGHIADARKLLGDIVTSFLINDDTKGANYAQLQAGQASLRAGNVSEAQHEVLASLGYYRAQQNDRLVAYANSILAEIMLEQGAIADARAKALDVLHAREKGGWQRIASQSKVALAFIDLADGNQARADESLRALLADPNAGLLNGDRIEALADRALALIALERADDALPLINQAMTLIADDDSEPLALLVGRAHALAAARIARPAAIAELAALRKRAETGGYAITALDLRLAAARIDVNAGKTAHVARELADIAATADKLGLGLIAKQARELLAAN